ncbi:hypothetical protein D3C80_728440 [compost metagenome]
MGLALQAHQQVPGLGVAQHIGDGFLGDAKGGYCHFFGNAGKALLAVEAPVNGGVVQRTQQVRAQAGLKTEAGQLTGVEHRRDVTHVGQRLVERATQGCAVCLQLCRRAALNPFSLERGGGQQLADVVVQFATQAMALVLLDVQQTLGKLLGQQFDRLSRLAEVPGNGQHCQHVQTQQAGGGR